MKTIEQPTERRQAPRGRIHLLRNLLYTTLRFIGRHIRGFWGAIVAFFTAGILIGLTAAIAFLSFAAFVLSGYTQPFDEAALHWFQSHRTPRLDEIVRQVTTLGNGVVLWMIVFIASVFLWETRHRWSVSLLWVGVVGGSILNESLKMLFGRPRPSIVPGMEIVTSLSFPSGHAMLSLIVYGSVAFLVGRLEPTSKLRRTTWAVAAIIVLAIGISRMYLGVHYPTDVAAGFLAGLAWLAFVASGVTAVRFFAYRRPQVRAEEKGLEAGADRVIEVAD